MVHGTNNERVWTVAEAKARLSEILRLAETEGPQVIGLRRSLVVVPQNAWRKKGRCRKPLGQWLIDNMPRGTEFPVPSRNEPGRETSFVIQNDE